MRGGQRLLNLGVFLLSVASCVSTLAVSVYEDAVPGSRVEQLGDATDHYEIVHQVPAAPRFILGGAHMADLLVPGERLDAETCNFFNLNITKTDQDNRTLTAYLQVRVLDVNEFAPEFSQPSYSANVTVDSVDSVEVLQLQAVDGDLEAKVEFSITDGNILDTFGIKTVYWHAAQSAATGQIYVQTNKQFTQPIYTLTVAASDGSKSALATVLIHYIDECSSNPCQNGATCYNLQNSYSCQCVPGWTGTNCQADIDECSSNPCQNGATCKNLLNGYSCQCVSGWTGTNCQADIDECATNPCQNGATCYNLKNNYSCQCVPGWTGTNCQADIDECGSNPCQNGATCYNLQNGYSCQCVPGWTGTNCQADFDECANNPCQNGATCYNLQNSYSCQCVSGWTGANCQTDIDECATNPCQNGATCYNLQNGYSCQCVPGWTGTNCQADFDECATNPCQNGATCYNLKNSYSCQCVPGWTGTNCQADIDECATNPCQNGATCYNLKNSYSCQCVSGWTGTNCQTDIDECGSNPCQNGATCYNLQNGYSCQCVSGWTGTNCQTDIDECGSNPCQNGATCYNLQNGYSCQCVSGWTGTNCQTDIDECATNPCQNGATCYNLQNSYSCQCVPGWTGTNCQTDIDECATNPCQNGATCYNLQNGYSCQCVPGWTGTNCQADIDECGSNPCQNGATCYNLQNGYSCQCVPGWTRTNCQADIDECGSNPCQNGATCYNLQNGYSCQCVSGWTGPNCQTDIDECGSNPCQNGATCYNLQNGYSCQCVSGWTGTNCQTDIDECGSNPCQNGATCYNLQNSYSCQCVSGWTGTNCQTDIDECATNPCQNDATCSNLQNIYSCQCVPGWTGTNCQTGVPNTKGADFDPVPTTTPTLLRVPTSVVASGGMCPAQADQHGTYWGSAPAPSRPYLEHACPPHYTGEVYRRCDENAAWHKTVYNCTADTLTQLKQEMQISGPNVTFVLKKLVNFTSAQNDSTGTLLVGDVQETTDILEGIVDIVDAEGQVADEQFEDFLRVADNLMDADTTDSWRSIIAETSSGVDKVLTNIDRYVEKVAKAERESVNKTNFVQTNFYVELGETGGGAGAISFPDRSSANVPHWASTAVNTISLPLHKGIANVSYSSIIYKDLRDMIPEWSNNSQLASDELNSPVISLTLFTEDRRPLHKPTTITFQLFERQLHNPRCTFWNERFAFWDTAGCGLTSYDADSGVVVCTCSHLTNFAVLMSHAPASAAHHTALGIISMVGCITSMLCLVLTFALYVYYWKSVKSELAQLLLHLCTVLFLAYLTFLLGVDKTAHKTVCTAVAVILHFLYLTVFFIMLAKSLYLAKMCLLPLNKTPITKWCLLAAYGGPVLVVGVSLGVTQLHGYGTETTCWLSIHSGLLWAFVGPVLFVIVVNVGVVILALKVKFSTHAMKKKTHTRKIAEGVRTILLLLPAMGVTWVLGVFSVNEETLVFQYLFAICNSLQGLLIFTVHCLWDKKMRKQVDKTFRRSVRKVRLQGPSSSNAKSTSGTDSTLDTKMTSSPSMDCKDKSFATAI